MRISLLAVLILYCVGAFAQQSPLTKPKTYYRVNSSLQNMCRPVSSKRDSYIGMPVNTNPSRRFVAPAIQSTANEQEIGTTYYDQQTNGSISNRIVYNSDGTISAVWMFSPDFGSNYPNRGTGYNYFDGSQWQSEPTVRIEAGTRTGYTNIGVTSTNKEAVIAHGIELPVSPSTTETSLGMVLSTRTAKGTGSWLVDPDKLGEEYADTTDLWPKMAVGGTDGKTIHAIWLGLGPNVAAGTRPKIDGLRSPVFYSRSLDEGVTWDKLDSIIPQIDSTQNFGFSADEYAIDAIDSTVAIVLGGEGTDLILLKSTDDGNSWTRTVVFKFPISNFDPTTMTTDTTAPHTGTPDTLLSTSGDPAVLIDRNGEVHVFFSVVRIVGYGKLDSLFYFPYTDGLDYWNEGMGSAPAKLIAYAPDLNGDSIISIASPSTSICPIASDRQGFGNYGGGETEKPSAGVDANNNIYLSYQTVDELSDTISYGKTYKHIYMIKSTDGGAHWTNPNLALDVVKETQWQNNADEDLEGVFAAMPKRFNDKVPIIYQRDGAPGAYVISESGTCDYNHNLFLLNGGIPNKIIFVSIDTSLQSTVGVHELPNKTYGIILSQNFPNPTSISTQFNVTLNAAMNVKVDVTDIVGQNVYSENKGMLSSGIHTITLNTAYLSSGVYFYMVTAGNEKLTGKMIVN